MINQLTQASEKSPSYQNYPILMHEKNPIRLGISFAVLQQIYWNMKTTRRVVLSLKTFNTYLKDHHREAKQIAACLIILSSSILQDSFLAYPQ